MLLWLDDVRTPPSAEWTWVKTADDAISALHRGCVSKVSLDHDLGPEESGNGYMVISRIEMFAYGGLLRKVPDEILIHTANPVARVRMEQALVNINTYRKQWTGK